MKARGEEDLHALTELRCGEIGLVVGPSGCGKSTLLKDLRAAVCRGMAGESCTSAGMGKGENAECAEVAELRGEEVEDKELEGGGRGVVAVAPLSIYRRDASVIDLLPCGLERSLELLALVGLGDAMVVGRRYSELSVGERARFDLARAVARARADRVWILADEFLTPLDRPTAAAIARTVRWAARNGALARARFVAATAHADVAEWLEPDVLIEMGRAEQQSSRAANRRG